MMTSPPDTTAIPTETVKRRQESPMHLNTGQKAYARFLSLAVNSTTRAEINGYEQNGEIDHSLPPFLPESIRFPGNFRARVSFFSRCPFPSLSFTIFPN